MAIHEHDHPEVAGPGGHVQRREDDALTPLAQRALADGSVSSLDHRSVMHLQRAAGNASVGGVLEDETEGRSPVLDVVGKGGGSPLDRDTQGAMEQHLGADLSDVRVHTDGQAAASAQAVGAKAYTVGNDVVFNEGAYSPGSTDGQQTLAHELTHVVQQRSGPVDGTPTGGGIAVSHPSDRFEQAAESSASSFVAGQSAAPTAQRQTGEEEDETNEAESVELLPLQRAEMPEEEEELAAQQLPLQRQDQDEMQYLPLQRGGEEEEEIPIQPLQRQDEEEIPPGDV